MQIIAANIAIGRMKPFVRSPGKVGFEITQKIGTSDFHRIRGMLGGHDIVPPGTDTVS